MMNIIEEPEWWHLPIENAIVMQCLVDFAFTLLFRDATDEVFNIRIEQPFTIQTPAGLTWFHAEERITELGPALDLHQKVLSSGRAYKNGVLTLIFLDGTTLQAHPDPQGNYEAWSIVETQGTLMVSLPSGGLAIW